MASGIELSRLPPQSAISRQGTIVHLSTQSTIGPVIVTLAFHFCDRATERGIAKGLPCRAFRE